MWRRRYVHRARERHKQTGQGGPPVGPSRLFCLQKQAPQTALPQKRQKTTRVNKDKNSLLSPNPLSPVVTVDESIIKNRSEELHRPPFTLPQPVYS